MPIDLILGTAGHIDHGKTTLIKALTGVDTDRLPEEKRRGITIELGFAEMMLGDLRLGIVDVPGHERLVRNMLAGATGFDVALLVVAADDSAKPQTREHLEILRLLDLSSGVIALTKIDLADPEWVDLVEAEIRELVVGTFLEHAPIVRTSATAGTGLEELREALSAAARQAVEQRRGDSEQVPFRMAIDRSFPIEGHGTVVTGSVLSGGAQSGATLALEPGATTVRVRGLQNHDRSVEEVHRGQRAAINLAGVHHHQLHRGQELATPGYLQPSRRLTARIRLSASVKRPLKQRGAVRLHLGTYEVVAQLSILKVDEPDVDSASAEPVGSSAVVRPGREALVQLFLADDVVATWRQPFVLRSLSPAATIGGGHVLDPTATRIRPADQKRIAIAEQLASEKGADRVAAAIYFTGWQGWDRLDLQRAAGVDLSIERIVEQLLDDETLLSMQFSPTQQLVIHREVFAELAARVERQLGQLHAEEPLKRAMDPTRLKHRVARAQRTVPALDAVLDRMAAEGRLRRLPGGIALAGHGPQLSRGEQQLLEKLVATLAEAGIAPPSVSELQRQADKNKAAVPQLLALAESEGQLVHISDQFYLHHATVAQVQDKLRDTLGSGEGLSLSQIREQLGTTRKYAVPLCEYLDRIGFTRRVGDARVLG